MEFLKALLLVTSVGASKYSSKEIDCLSVMKLYDNESDACHDILQQGPCQEDEWFVLQKPSQFSEYLAKGVCESKECDGDELYIRSEGMCIGREDQHLFCQHSPSTKLENSWFGDAICLCQQDPPYVRMTGVINSRCYKLFERGPCNSWEIVGFREAYAPAPECIPDQCTEERKVLRLSDEWNENSTITHYEGNCYILNTQGPCKKPLLFQFNALKRQAMCMPPMEEATHFATRWDMISGGDCLKTADNTCAEIAEFNKKPSGERAGGSKKELFREYLKCIKDGGVDCNKFKPNRRREDKGEGDDERKRKRQQFLKKLLCATYGNCTDSDSNRTFKLHVIGNSSPYDEYESSKWKYEAVDKF